MIICDVKLIYRERRDGQTEKIDFNLSESWEKGQREQQGEGKLFTIPDFEQTASLCFCLLFLQKRETPL